MVGSNFSLEFCTKALYICGYKNQALLSYFKINDPFRLLPLFLLTFLIKLPALLNPVIYPEATHWFVIGEAMQTGSMYCDIWDGLAPLSASIYQAFTWLFGRSVLMLLIFGTVLSFFQAAIINTFSANAKLFENNTYLPALAYVIITSTHPAFFTLSPSLMGLTLVLLGLGKLLNHVEFRAKADIHFILIGLYFGIAALFHLAFIVIIPVSVVLLILFSSTVLRRYFLLLLTSITPLIIAFFYYWFISDHSAYYVVNFVLINNLEAYYTNIGWLNGIIILGFALVFFIMGLFTIGKQRRLTNYQYRIAQLFFVLAVLLMSTLLVYKPITHYSLVIFTPVASYFMVHLMALFRRPIYTIMLSLILLAGPIALLWSIAHTWFPKMATSPSITVIEPYKKIIKDKHIMVLGSGKDLYDEASLAGPFYDWGLSKPFFENLNYYDNLIFLQRQLTKTAPEIIIDLENNWKTISKSLPAIADDYRLAQPNVWVRKNSRF